MLFRSVLFPLTFFCAFAFGAVVSFHQCKESLGWLAAAIPCTSAALLFAYLTVERLRGR